MINILQYIGKIFIPHPYVSLFPALLLALIYFYNVKNKLILTTSILWLLYAIYEELHLLRILCSGECNIRIDLLVIYPVLFIMSIISLFLWIKNLSNSNAV